MQEFLQTVNWKTTGLAIGFVVCKIVGGIYPEAASVCNVLDTLIVAGGFVSAADSSRVQSVVRAVDTLLWKNKMDPSTLAPLEYVRDIEKPLTGEK